MHFHFARLCTDAVLLVPHILNRGGGRRQEASFQNFLNV